MTALSTAVLTLAYHEDGSPRDLDAVRALLRELPVEDVARIELAASRDYELLARRKQREPEGSWRWWFLNSGRGFGKTWTAAGVTNARVEQGRAKLVGLIARDAAMYREVMVEGPDGLIARSKPWFRPRFESSKARVTWPNGATGVCLAAAEPDSIRGYGFDWEWCEEVSSWRYARAFWEGAELCLRKDSAQGIITSTPKPNELTRDLLLGRKDTNGQRTRRDDLVVTTGSTYENVANLAPGFLDALRSQYEGTNLGRQELYGELLEDGAAAMFTYETIEQHRVSEAPELKVLVVSVDPTWSATGAGDEAGIIIGGLGVDGHAYVLDDKSLKAPPDEWAKLAIRAYHDRRADRITYEGNFGRDVVRKTIGVMDPRIKLKEVTATRGKLVRAEPVSALYQQGKVHHVGMFAKLEDELTGWHPGMGRGDGQTRSPGRFDALVWLIHDLLLEAQSVPLVAPRPMQTRYSPWRTDWRG